MKLRCVFTSFNYLSNLALTGLPKKRTRLTVLRSPHIDKRSREQFEFQKHRSTITLTYSSATHLYHWLQLQDHPGFQCKVVVTYTTRLPLSCVNNCGRREM